MPNAPDAKLQHWGRVDDVLMIRFAGEIAAPAAAVWDIIRDGSRRAELDELLDQSCVPSALAIHMPSSSQQPRLAAQTLASSPVGLCVLLIYIPGLAHRNKLEDLSPLISIWQCSSFSFPTPLRCSLAC